MEPSLRKQLFRFTEVDLLHSIGVDRNRETSERIHKVPWLAQESFHIPPVPWRRLLKLGFRNVFYLGASREAKCRQGNCLSLWRHRGKPAELNNTSDRDLLEDLRELRRV